MGIFTPGIFFAPGSALPKPGATGSGPETPPIPSADQGTEIDLILSQTWDHYKKNMIGLDGRPFTIRDHGDQDRDDDREEFITLSEGVSYVLLRAAWMNDEATFSQVWRWTRDNLQRKNIKFVYTSDKKRAPAPTSKQDNLFAWRYFDKLRSDNYRGIVTYESGVKYDSTFKDLDPATDADIDIAAALIAAYKKWGKQEYLDEAKAILKDIWNKETVVVNGERLLVGSDGQKNINGQAGVNPSYFRWGYYKTIFAEADGTDHDWSKLFDSSYRVLVESADSVRFEVKMEPFTEGKSFGIEPKYYPLSTTLNLPSDWLAVKSDGTFTYHPWLEMKKKNARFGSDAFRVLFWTAFQHDLNPADQQANRYLMDQTGTAQDFGPHWFLKQQLDRYGYIRSGYMVDGTSPWAEKTENTAVYLTYFMEAGDTASGQKLYQRLMRNYNKEGYWGNDPLEYYGQSWAWLSLALLRYGAQGLWDKDQPKRPVPLPAILPTLMSRPSIDGGFMFAQSANDFIDLQNQSISIIRNGSEGLIIYQMFERNAIETMGRASRFGAGSGQISADLINDVYPKIGEKYSLLWLIHREIGLPDANLLENAMNYLQKYFTSSTEQNNERIFFWTAKLATTLAGEPEDPAMVQALKRPPFVFDGEAIGQGLNPANVTKQDKLKVYQRIDQRLLLKLPDDQLFRADNLSMQGILLFDMEDPGYLKRFARSQELMEPFINPAHPRHNKVVEEYRVYLRRRILDTYLQPTEEDIFYKDMGVNLKDMGVNLAIQQDVAAARMSKAQMLMLTASKLPTESDEEKMLIDAGKLLKTASRDLTGVMYLAAKRMMAECLARRAFIMKNRKDDNYRKYLDLGILLLEDIHEWEKEFTSGVKEEKTTKYFKQVAALAKVWEIKIRSVELGEKISGSRPETIAAQKKELEELITSLTPMTDPAFPALKGETSIQADINRLYGELLVRLAYVDKDLGADQAKVMASVNRANAYLTNAYNNGPSPVKVAAKNWLVKSKLLAADYAKSRGEELGLATEAARDLDLVLSMAPSVKELKGRALSDLYNARGEIYLKLGDFKSALAWFTKAKDTDPNNFDAVLNLADVQSWQKNFAEAAKNYELALAAKVKYITTTTADRSKARFSDELAFDRAKLGLAELKFHRARDYQEMEKTAKGLLAGEAPASPLRKRAYNDLMELYSSRQEWFVECGNLYNITFLKKNPELVTSDRRFHYELARRYAEAEGGMQRYDWALSTLSSIPDDYLREEMLLTKAEMEMRRDEKTPAALWPAAQQVLAKRQDNPALALQALLDLMEAASSSNEQDYLTSIAIGSLLSGKTFSLPKPYAERLEAVKKAFPQLNPMLLEGLFNNISPAALASARIQVTSRLADALIWEKDHPAEIRTALNEEEQLIDANRAILPAMDGTIYAAKLYFQHGEFHRYGNGKDGPDKVRDLARSRQNYQKAIDEAEKKSIYGEWTDGRVFIGSVYTAWSALESANANPVAAWEKIYRASEIFKPLSAIPKSTERDFSIQRTSQLRPLVQAGSEVTVDPKGTQSLSYLRFNIPMKDDEWTLYGRLEESTNTNNGRSGTTAVFSQYLGVTYQPKWLFSKRLTLEAEMSPDWILREITGHPVLTVRNSDGSNYETSTRYPADDLRVRAVYWSNWATAEFYSNFAFADSGTTSTFFARLMANLSGLNNPYARLRFGPSYSRYGTTNAVAFDASWSLDFAEAIKTLNFGRVTLTINNSAPLFMHDEKTGQWRHLFDGSQQGATANFEIKVNLGRGGTLAISCGGELAQNTQSTYWSGTCSLDYSLVPSSFPLLPSDKRSKGKDKPSHYAE